MIVRYVVTYRETVTRRSRWVPDASNLGADQLSWRRISRGLELFYDDGGLSKSHWQPDNSNLGSDQLAWRGLKRGLDYTFEDGGALKLYYGALFSVQVPPPVIVVIRPTGTAVAASPLGSATPATPVTGAKSGSPEGSAS